MKRFLLIATVLLCAVVLTAGTLDKAIAKIQRVSMTVLSSSDTSTKVKGYVNRVDYTFGNSTSYIQIASVVASNELTGMTTAIPYPTGAIGGTNLSYQLTNYTQRLVLHDEAITIIATNAVYTNQSVMVTVFYERP